MNYKNLCLTCLSSTKEMKPANSNIIISGDDVRLSDILENFYNYKVPTDENYPENLCINCVHQLTLTYAYRKLIEHSEKKILDTLNLIREKENDYIESDYDDEDNKPLINLNKSYNHIPKQEPKLTIKRHQRRKSYITKPKLAEIVFCVECKAQFNCARSLYDHCLDHHPAKTTLGRDCEFCNEKFEDFRSLIIHRKLHMKPYLCSNCWEGYFSPEDLNKHLCQPKERDKNERVLRQCDQCGKSYPPGYIKIHMLTHSNDRRYACKYCPKRFKVPGGLNSHVLWNHKRTRNHKCEICNATFISSSSRSSHIRKNHLKEKKYACESCEKRFFSKSELQRHNLTHTGVKNFHCHLCDKSYQTRYGLNVHLKSHSQITMNVLTL